ncbi:MAG TPA: hypothetical protein PKB10_04480, partial [Tepidisphaeraceae bacterium]|nr:hypothetical protein [Tepidisphaeraceae bacterium]
MGKLAAFIPFFRRKTTTAPAVSAPAESDEEPRYKPITRAMVGKLFSSLRPHKWQYIAGLSVGLTHVLLEMQSPQFIGAIVNHLTDFISGQTGMSSRDASLKLMLIIGFWGLVLAVSIGLQRYTIL